MFSSEIFTLQLHTSTFRSAFRQTANKQSCFWQRRWQSNADWTPKFLQSRPRPDYQSAVDKLLAFPLARALDLWWRQARGLTEHATFGGFSLSFFLADFPFFPGLILKCRTTEMHQLQKRHFQIKGAKKKCQKGDVTLKGKDSKQPR